MVMKGLCIFVTGIKRLKICFQHSKMDGILRWFHLVEWGKPG